MSKDEEASASEKVTIERVSINENVYPRTGAKDKGLIVIGVSNTPL